MSTFPDEELFAALSELRSLFPDWRFGQLVANLTLAAGCAADGGIWEVEDEQIVAAAKRLILRNSSRVALSST